MTPVLTDLPEHIAARITVDPVTSEWVWNGPLDKDGYGRIGNQGAHRVVYELLVGPIPDNLVLDHAKPLGCTTRHDCVTPWCLEPVTHRVNVLRGTSFAAVNFAKTECDNGHEFDLLNTYISPTGRRDCRICIRHRVAEYKARVRGGQPVKRRSQLRQAALWPAHGARALFAVSPSSSTAGSSAATSRSRQRFTPGRPPARVAHASRARKRARDNSR